MILFLACSYPYVRRRLVGRYLVLRVDAEARAFRVEVQGRQLKTIPIKGLPNMFLGFQGYLELMRREAISEWRLTQMTSRRRASVLMNTMGS